MALTSLQLIAQATEVLQDNGYQQINVGTNWPLASRVFEDQYGIVAVRVFDTWRELEEGWPAAQSLLVDLISENIARPEPKVWEGYLVLLTSAEVLDADRQSLVNLRYNTHRLRKLCATGEDLGTLDDVGNVLRPLLPLQVEGPDGSDAGLLARLPDLLEADGIDRHVTQAAIAAYETNESIVQRLHSWRAEH